MHYKLVDIFISQTMAVMRGSQQPITVVFSVAIHRQPDGGFGGAVLHLEGRNKWEIAVFRDLLRVIAAADAPILREYFPKNNVSSNNTSDLYIIRIVRPLCGQLSNRLIAATNLGTVLFAEED